MDIELYSGFPSICYNIVTVVDSISRRFLSYVFHLRLCFKTLQQMNTALFASLSYTSNRDIMRMIIDVTKRFEICSSSKCL